MGSLTTNILKQKISAVDGQDYAAYQSILGEYDFDLFNLKIQQIPKDPYAPPHTGIYRILVDRTKEEVINWELDSKIKEIAFRDFLVRSFYQACQGVMGGIRGTGYSGIITINQPGQQILERNSVIVDDKFIEIRCFCGLPADGRKINAEIAQLMLFDELPKIVRLSLLKQNLDIIALEGHLKVAKDADFLRRELDKLGLVAFIAEDSILPRESGSSDQPMPKNVAIPFKVPKSLMKEIDLPHAGKIKGMGIPKGVTLIVGGGYHGKSTLLEALELGIYNHIPEDGREFCVSTSQTVKIRAYNGRNIVKTNISPFIKNLPFQKDTTAFSTQNASGSTSQAASIIEAVEVGAKTLLMDEDTCATNFMIRDRKMQQLVKKDEEPITAYIDKVKQLYQEKDISTILVLGGVGDYFEVSDTVIQMAKYNPIDVTSEAKRIAFDSTGNRWLEDDSYPFTINERMPLPESIIPFNEYGKFSVYAKETYRLNFGGQIIDLTDLEQLIDLSQTKALGYAIEYSKRYMDKKSSLVVVIQRVMKDIKKNGLDVLSDRISGNFAEFRSFELAFAINRIRGLKVKQQKQMI